jgi:hypothetical protein
VVIDVWYTEGAHAVRGHRWDAAIPDRRGRAQRRGRLTHRNDARGHREPILRRGGLDLQSDIRRAPLDRLDRAVRDRSPFRGASQAGRSNRCGQGIGNGVSAAATRPDRSARTRVVVSSDANVHTGQSARVRCRRRRPAGQGRRRGGTRRYGTAAVAAAAVAGAALANLNVTSAVSGGGGVRLARLSGSVTTSRHRQAVHVRRSGRRGTRTTLVTRAGRAR